MYHHYKLLCDKRKAVEETETPVEGGHGGGRCALSCTQGRGAKKEQLKAQVQDQPGQIQRSICKTKQKAWLRRIYNETTHKGVFTMHNQINMHRR